MQRRTSFEDFEELLKDSSSDSKTKSTRPNIPANGSELFEETRSDMEEIRLEDLDEPIVFEEVGPKKSNLSAEERYRLREQRLREKTQKKKVARHIGGKLLAVLQLILSIVLAVLLKIVDILPMKYYAAMIVVLVLLAAVCFLLQYRRKAHWLGKILSVLLCIALVFSNAVVLKAKGTLDTVTHTQTYLTDKIVVAVMADDPAESMEDAKDYKFGIISGLDRTKVDSVIDEINSKLKDELDITEYNSYSDVVADLYSGKIDAMMYNQVLDELIEENNPGFTEKVKILDNFEIKTEVYMEDVPDLPITKEPFVVYLSGVDAYGSLDQTCRSDVNMLACVNPVTKQVLLVSVPRDAYVEIPGITNGESDKLTHAGMYGVQYSMAALEEVFDVDIDYYVRINFTALIDMVDALGGVNVDSEYAFSTYYKQYDEATDTWSYYEYNKGLNHLDGVHALAFARERMNLVGGDYQRAANQQSVIKALVAKLKSPAVLVGYADLLSSLEGTMDTSLSSTQLASLVKMQLNDGAEWNIVSANVYGHSSSEYCASYAGSPLSVEILDDDSIAAVQEVIDALFAGEVISEPRVTDIQQMYEISESSVDEDYYINNHASDYEYDDFYWEHEGYLAEDVYETFEATDETEETVKTR